MKLLVVNADDFGFTRDVNEGIVEAHRNGILTATTLMANGAAFDDAVRLTHENPSLDVGAHLVLVGGSALTTGDPLPATVSELLKALFLRKMRVYDELKAQIRRILDAGITPTHLDTHKHTHLAPPVLDAVARLAEEFGIRWVRRPFDLPVTAARGPAPLLKRAANQSLGLLRLQFHQVLTRRNCKVTDHFAGFQLTGRLRAAELAALIRELPEGATEFMCHPGKLGDELRAARTRLKESREEELLALTAPEIRAALAQTGVRLANYRTLSEVR